MGARLIKSKKILEVGGFLNKWFESRVINKNQNVIVAVTGSTGSGKTYSCLSQAESWYREQFKCEYPAKNICFSLGILAKRIEDLHKEGRLRKGELLILEEGGANLGNLDFQNKLAKLFGYILQSFRSMNLILLITLPVLTMLNKTARQLIHAHFITTTIDYENKVSKVKPYFHQLSQATGKSYWKYPRVKINGKVITLQRLKFNLPSEKLIEEYEKMKVEFVFNLTQEFVVEAEKVEKNNLLKESRRALSPTQETVLKYVYEGLTKEQMAELLHCTLRNIEYHLEKINKKGYNIYEKMKNFKDRNSVHRVSHNVIT